MIIVAPSRKLLTPLLQEAVRGDFSIFGKIPLDPPFPKGDDGKSCKVFCAPRSKSGLLRTVWALALMALLFVGCRSTPSPVFYTLTTLAKGNPTAESPAPKGDLAVGIGPAQLPEYLNRPQIATRTAPDRLTLSEFNRWGGSLSRDFLRVLAENVAALLGTDRVLAYPWGDRLEPTYRVALDVQRFDGQLGETVLLKATWIVTGGEGKTPLAVRKSDIQEPVSGKDYDALVAAHSRALATLSREIADEIRKLAGGTAS
jgi:uncharacterized lipoprotein YmbA